MKKYLVTEIRETDNGQEFVIETVINAKSKDSVKIYIDTTTISFVKDKNYKIKEIKNER